MINSPLHYLDTALLYMLSFYFYFYFTFKFFFLNVAFQSCLWFLVPPNTLSFTVNHLNFSSVSYKWTKNIEVCMTSSSVSQIEQCQKRCEFRWVHVYHWDIFMFLLQLRFYNKEKNTFTLRNDLVYFVMLRYFKYISSFHPTESSNSNINQTITSYVIKSNQTEMKGVWEFM